MTDDKDNHYIIIKGARVHNLKNIDIAIRRNKLVVITGLSGSGKSSLAFDTLYAEGQRRYVESLSSYARQFLGRISKPDVDFIKGIPPAIAIEQKVNTMNPRSTVGTSTEIYDYLKLLYARIGRTISPVSGNQVRRHSVTDVVDYVLSLPHGSRVMIESPLQRDHGRELFRQLEVLQQQGFTRLDVGDVMKKISDVVFDPDALNPDMDISLVIDRMEVNKNDADFSARAADSVQLAFYEGNGTCIVKMVTEEDGKSKKSPVPEYSGQTVTFSNRFEADGIIFEDPSVHMFSFNNPIGACKTCEGFGRIIGIDKDLVIPNKSLSIFNDAVACWKGEKLSQWKERLVYTADKFNFPVHKPYFELTDDQKKLIWTGNKYFDGLDEFFSMLERDNYKIQNRVMLARYRGKTICPDCRGTRLKKEAGYVRVSDRSIHELVLMPVDQLLNFFQELSFSDYENKLVKRIYIEIVNRLGYLCDVGLGYLTLNRLSNTLSGGESQRINLATSLGSSLVGSLYILDEPSIGLHPRDSERLISVLRKLQKLGNTVVVVEHDEKIIREADEIIDMGPLAGILGGEVVFHGDHKKLMADSGQSLTAAYMTGKMKIDYPQTRRKWNNYIEVTGARENNLKNLHVKFPLNIITVVTGVSGSGKSSLIKNILYRSLKRIFGGSAEKAGDCDAVTGDLHLITDVEFVDQNPIGRSSRSNPVTYIKAYDDIRKLFSEQPLSKHNGFQAGHFSFNIEGGRCEECQGDGYIKVEMQFMADVTLECESCHGKRFKEDVLDVKFRDKSIFDILELSVDEAIEFFGESKDSSAIRVAHRLKPLSDVGLGYVKLGQASSTLSGGESQRIKLASFLAKEKSDESILFMFDEPTTGLHFHDISKLLDAFNALIRRKHTIIIIEHNLEIIKCADWVIDLGKEGGLNGGNIVFEGTPENLAGCKESYTAKYLAGKL
ncbi:MAG: excinuclease ABC subunit UvrA [Bacteroidia bacterium]|nr:excinuclease ABC subunit UvrA [Bacteroidia bacterium]